MTAAKALKATDEGVIHGGELITFRALPFPLSKSDQDALKSAAAAVKSGDVSHAVLERVEAEIRKYSGFTYTRMYIPPVERKCHGH